MSNPMTPTEQNKELRIELARKVYPKPTPSEIMTWGTPEAVIDEVYSEAPIVYEFARYITADRKRVALEARIAELDDIVSNDSINGYNVLNHCKERRYQLAQQRKEK